MTRRRGTPISAKAQYDLRRICGETEDEQMIAHQIGITRVTLARAMAGLPLYAGTQQAITEYLELRRIAA